MKVAKVFFLLALVTCLFYLPILVNPSLILERGNDLQEYYIPIAYFTKEHLLKEDTLPFWNSMFFSGTPLLPDPQSLLFYPLNLIFLILPINSAFIVWFMLHTLFGGIGSYLVAKKGFGFQVITSIFVAIFFITYPRTAGFLEAGHFTLVAATVWLPYLLLSIIKLIRDPKFEWSLLLAVSLLGLFFTFPTMFAIGAGTVAFIILYSFICRYMHSFKTFIFLGVGFAITFGLSAITLFPQLEWIPQTTRYILLEDRDVYPKWAGISEFIKAMYPQVFGMEKLIFSLDSEKWITTGLLLTLLAGIGFLKVNFKLKVLIIFLISIIVITSLNNISPIQSLLLSSDWYVLSRVPTRNWFVVILILVYLAGFGLEHLLKGRFKKLALLIAILGTVELLALSWVRLERPVPIQNEQVQSNMYEFLAKDPEIFRVFCVTRCLSQRDVAKYNLETIEGYATIYQKNYYNQFIQLSQVFWDKYSSTLPPISVYNFREIQPIAAILADQNVKYVISPYNLKDKDFKEVGKFGKFTVFENTLFRTRAYYYAKGVGHEIEAPILYYSPNKIIIDTSKQKAQEVIIAQTWSSGWKAKSDEGKKIKVTEASNKLISIKIGKTTKSIELYYYPESYRLGKSISIFTVLALGLYFVLSPLKRKEGFKRPRQKEDINIIS